MPGSFQIIYAELQCTPPQPHVAYNIINELSICDSKVQSRINIITVIDKIYNIEIAPYRTPFLSSLHCKHTDYALCANTCAEVFDLLIIVCDGVHADVAIECNNVG